MITHRYSLAAALTLVFVSLLAGGASFAQETFDYDQYEALDQQVVAADEALLAEDEGSRAWVAAAIAAEAARREVVYYITMALDDPALDDTERDTLRLIRATLSIDRAQIFVRIGDCAEAARWADAARADAHPEVEDALARAEAGVLECEAALVAAAPPPEPTPEPMAPTSEPAAAAAASDPGVTTRSDVVRPDLVEAGPGRDRSGRVGWSLVGAGVALGGAALAIDAVGASDRNTIDRLACGETLCADPADRAVYSAADSAENRRLVPIVLLGTVGLGAGVTGIVKLARRGRESDTADVSLRWTGTGVGARVGW